MLELAYLNKNYNIHDGMVVDYYNRQPISVGELYEDLCDIFSNEPNKSKDILFEWLYNKKFNLGRRCMINFGNDFTILAEDITVETKVEPIYDNPYGNFGGRVALMGRQNHTLSIFSHLNGAIKKKISEDMFATKKYREIIVIDFRKEIISTFMGCYLTNLNNTDTHGISDMCFSIDHFTQI